MEEEPCPCHWCEGHQVKSASELLQMVKELLASIEKELGR